MTEPTEKHREEAERIVIDWRNKHVGSLDFHLASLTSMITTALSARDAEVREVLEGLRAHINQDCWCRTCSEGHSSACLAARALFERLSK